VVRSRAEAATELIRLEYERDRLTQTLSSIEQRRADARERLRQIDERARLLLGFLEAADADAPAQSGPAIPGTRPPRQSKGSPT
jgi:hypothetical protein